MVQTIALISNANITREDFMRFLQSVGGVIVRETPHFEGRLSDGERHLWISHRNEELNYLTDKALEAIPQKLGKTPRSCFIVDMSSSDGTHALAGDFALKFAERWACIIADFVGDIVTVEDFRSRYNTPPKPPD